MQHQISGLISIFLAFVLLVDQEKCSNGLLVPSLSLEQRCQQVEFNKGELLGRMEDIISSNKINLASSTPRSIKLRIVKESIEGSGEIPCKELNIRCPSWNNDSLLWSSQSHQLANNFLDLLLAVAFDYPTTEFDPYLNAKLNNLKSANAFIDDVSARLQDILDLPRDEALQNLFYISFLGNYDENFVVSSPDDGGGGAGADGSRPGAKKAMFQKGLDAFKANIVIDSVDGIVKHLLECSDGIGGAPRNVDVVVDGTGKGLFVDLVLAHGLLTLKCCDTVTLHCKSYPTVIVQFRTFGFQLL